MPLLISEPAYYKNLQAEMLEIRPPLYKNLFSMEFEGGSYLQDQPS